MENIGNLKKKENNLIFLLILGIFFVIFIFLFNKKYNDFNEPHIIVSLTALFSILFGIVLSIDYLLDEQKKEGKWNLNKYKILYISLPSFILTIYPIIYYRYPISILPYQIDSIIMNPNNNLLQVFIGITLGYSIISALYKE